MSHISVLRVRELKNAVVNLLEKALEIVAEKLNCELVRGGVVTDYLGRAEKADFILQIPGLGRANGIGIRIGPNGTVELIGDMYGREELFQKVQQLLVQYYTALAVVEAAKRAGMRVEHVDEVGTGTERVIVIDLAR
jgi:hypothetical protein